MSVPVVGPVRLGQQPGPVVVTDGLHRGAGHLGQLASAPPDLHPHPALSRSVKLPRPKAPARGAKRDAPSFTLAALGDGIPDLFLVGGVLGGEGTRESVETEADVRFRFMYSRRRTPNAPLEARG